MLARTILGISTKCVLKTNRKCYVPMVAMMLRDAYYITLTYHTKERYYYGMCRNTRLESPEIKKTQYLEFRHSLLLHDRFVTRPFLEIAFVLVLRD